MDLAYQDFDAELADLPGKYAPPAGEILLAWGAEEKPIGCVALRPLGEPGVCEMKRLFVAPAGRGEGLGRMLVAAIIEVARERGHHTLWLDTLPTMHAAQALYRSLGFAPASPYYDSPVPCTLFMRLAL